MSYCVNCGVELDSSLNKCPLCGTIVYNPKQYTTADSVQESTFPKRTGEVEKVNRRDSVIFVTILLLTITVTCGLLNGLVYDKIWWSAPVNGVCMILWIFFIAAILIDKITIYGMLLSDAGAIAIYLYLISRLTETKEWLTEIGLPILGITFLLLELFTFLGKKLPFSLLVGTLYFFLMVAGVCVTIEIVIDLYIIGIVHLSWSAIVLTVCAIISVGLVMMLMMRRLRNNISRRLHF